MKLTKLFTEFFQSEKSSGIILMACSVISMVLVNSAFGNDYLSIWHAEIFSKSTEFWINDGLMTIFFLLIGLEIEREIYIGELSSIKKSMLPVLAALGGMFVPAAIHISLNNGTAYKSGFGIPMATDIAFSLAILSLLGKRVPASLKIFLTALAIIDDLGAIIVIALFYSTGFSILFFTLAVLTFAGMILLNRFKVYNLLIYLIMGGFLWYCLYQTGIHPTITGVLLAFAIPFSNGDEHSLSYKLQHRLHNIVAFGILPIFALANTAIVLPDSITDALTNTNSLGIIFGLVIGKPFGILFFSVLGITLGLCSMPKGILRRHIFGVGMLAGIGFTMSIFITLLAFSESSAVISSKISVLAASLFAGTVGYLWLRFTLTKEIMNPDEI